MSLSFSEWKTKTMLSLLKMAEDADDKLRQDLNTLITRLEHLKSRDLSRWLRDLWAVANYHAEKRKQLLQLAPTEEEITSWFSREE